MALTEQSALSTEATRDRDTAVKGSKGGEADMPLPLPAVPVVTRCRVPSRWVGGWVGMNR